MSPEPCQRTSSTSALSNSPLSEAGRNRVNPVFVVIAAFSLAYVKINLRAVIPARDSIIGRANSSNVTIVDVGFPGRPRKYVPPSPGGAASRAGAPALHVTLPNTIGFPG